MSFIKPQPLHRRPRQRHWRRWSAAGLLMLGLWQLPVHAQTAGASSAVPTRSLTDWLIRLHDASNRRAYTGTLMVSSSSSLSVSRIWHICDGSQQMERVDTLTGAPRSTIRHNSDVVTFVPDSKVALIDKRESLGVLPELLQTPNNSLPDFYNLREAGAERVAGYLADVVEIQPRDKLRFGYRIWAERKTGLIVKLQTLGEGNAVLEQVAFSELHLDAPVRMDKLKRMMNDTKGYDVHRLALHKTSPEAEGWRLKEPVPGFSSMSCYTRTASSGVATEHAPMQWVFSDGLASVSLFVEPFDAQQHVAERASVVGATNTLTHRVGEFWVTAMGEVPPATLQRFATALERTR